MPANDSNNNDNRSTTANTDDSAYPIQDNAMPAEVYGYDPCTTVI